ncbi:MAG TPA: hypothetical protein VEI01_02385 [Terriglobales bacterium]|nr:hypothetical protein [Terriglobales bacterium]
MRDEQVLGLQVAMHDTFAVRGRKSSGNLNGIVDRLAQCQRAIAQHLAQRLVAAVPPVG